VDQEVSMIALFTSKEKTVVLVTKTQLFVGAVHPPRKNVELEVKTLRELLLPKYTRQYLT